MSQSVPLGEEIRIGGKESGRGGSRSKERCDLKTQDNSGRVRILV